MFAVANKDASPEGARQQSLAWHDDCLKQACHRRIRPTLLTGRRESHKLCN